MHTLNHTLEDLVLESDGRYLNLQGLSPLEQYIQSYHQRLETYHQLREQNGQLVLEALRKLAQTYPDLIKQHGPRCKYDMTEVLRYIALSVLRDDEIFFKEQMMSWLDTILVAYHRHNHCATAYHYLQDVLASRLPEASNTLIRPYLNVVIMSLESHA